MKPENVNTYIFDLDDTLYEEMQYVRAGMQSVSKYLSKKYGIEFNKLYDSCLIILERDGRGKVFDKLCEDYKLKEDIKTLVEKYRGTKPKLTLYSDAEKFLMLLKEAGCKIGIITDGNAQVQEAKVKGLNLDKWTDAVLLTDRMKDEDGHSLSKPATRVYEECLKMLGSTAEESVYIGDNPNKDFIGAKMLGMKTVRIIRETGMFVSEVFPEEYEAEMTIHSLEELVT